MLMKLSKLFLMSSFALMSLTVGAAEINERTAPEAPSTVPAFYNGDLSVDDLEMTPASFQVGKMYVLYNVTEQTFFSQGCAWATQAATSSTVPLAVSFYLPEGKTLADATLLMRDYNLFTNAWNNVFFDSETALFTDRGSQANIYFQVIDQGSKTYRIQASEANPSLKPSAYTGFVGRDETVTYSGDNNGRTVADTSAQPISPFLAEGDGHHIDWQFFELPQLSDWEEYFQLLDIFNKSEELKKAINDAQDAGVNADAAIEVYNNESSTIAQMAAAIAALTDAIANNTFAGFTPGTALDVTKLIVNPDFKGNDLSGWSGDGWGAYNPKENAERYNMTFDTYQDIAGLRAGLYVVGANAFYRAGNSGPAYENYQAQNEESKYAKFYVTAGENTFTADIVSPYEGAPTAGTGKGSESSYEDTGAGVTYYIPNDMVAAEYYMHSLGLYKNSIFAEVSAGDIRIGMKKEDKVDGDWLICDDFSLIYCGEGAQAYKAYVEYYRDNSFPDYEALRVEASDPFVTTEGINCSDSYVNGLKNANVTATDEASARAAMAQLDAIFDEARQNVSLWTEYLALAKKASNEVANNDALNHNHPIVEEVDDWTILAAEDWNAHEMTNEELRAFIDEMTEKIKEAKKQVITNTGEIYATDLLVNPDFENGTTGWTIEKVSGGNVVHGGNNDNHCFEGWNNANYDIYQVVKDAPEGVYRIEVQGFYRYGRNQAYDDYKAQTVDYVKPNGAPVFVYMNQKKTPFTNIFGDEKQIDDANFYAGTAYEDVPVNAQGNKVSVDEAVGHLYFPNDMASAAKAFSAQMYKQSAYGIIRAGQEMRIGVKGNSSQLGDSWCIWDNFQLFNCGKDVTALNNVLPEEIENAKSMLVDENGQPRLMGKDIVAALATAIANAESALGTTGDAMFDALNDLFDAEENVDASVALFKQLATANDKLMTAIENNQESPVLEEAQQLYEEILTAFGNYEYNDSDVADKLAEINKMLIKMRMPSEEEYKDASPLNPVDFTQVIENPGYDTEEGTASADGWLGTAVGTNDTGLNAEVFNNTFDVYQEFYGLPAGQYEVSVLGFYRYSGDGPTFDYAAWTEDPTANNNALLYANSNSVALKRLAAYADGAHAGEDNWAEVAEGSGLYVPNMMDTGGVFFEEQGDNVRNYVKAIVGADGYLRIGLKKDVAVANDWTLFDTWQLMYLGAAAGIPGDTNADGTVDVADISAVISHMAGTADYGEAADVNGDGSVDVADISNIITIMAAQARLAKMTIEE